ncbi:hypothetical protein [Neobacillus mesonae]|uniref:hypothetical protein n=1 Tax=Neobacillus mesonae TaxID=1193713 RepID=UPI00203B4D45|nr:hypothetical protein [Neobacillus mesonae]MCM3569357.1 hypothetical protein [Neobacillus mesonae]
MTRSAFSDACFITLSLSVVWGRAQDDAARKKIAEKVAETCFDLGLVVYPGSGNVNGKNGDTLLIAPPFIITEDEIQELTEKFKQAIEMVESSINKYR